VTSATEVDRLFLVQSLHLGLALLLGALFLGHILGHGGSGVSVESRDPVLGLIFDGLDGELLLALLRKTSVLGLETKASVQLTHLLLLLGASHSDGCFGD
jgi:hypothetical protein